MRLRSANFTRSLFIVFPLLAIGVWMWPRISSPLNPAAQASPGTAWEALRPAGVPDASWRHDALWDDGLAEYSAYEAKWYRYGRLNQGRVLLVAVKEPWRPDLEVKADRESDAKFDVIKLNHQRSVQTGIYRYEQVASVFMRRQQGQLQKLSTASAEGCGLSTAHMTKGLLELRSYFDGQAERRMPWPAAAIPEDGLALFLRDYVKGVLPESIKVFPSTLHGRFLPAEPLTLSMQRSQPKDVVVPAGRFRIVELTLGKDNPDRFSFEIKAPHRLIEMTLADGTNYRLAKSERIAYWERHDAGDESWWPQSLR
ncbi:MAG: hypothetical protein V3W41_17800 [Planctomycetota bacterium]